MSDDDDTGFIDLKNTPHPVLEGWLLKTAIKIELYGLKYAEAKAMYEQLEDAKKTVLYGAMPEEGPAVERERIAHTAMEYQRHLEGLANARFIFYRAQVYYNAAQVKFDAIRSILSMRKQELTQKI